MRRHIHVMATLLVAYLAIAPSPVKACVVYEPEIVVHGFPDDAPGADGGSDRLVEAARDTSGAFQLAQRFTIPSLAPNDPLVRDPEIWGARRAYFRTAFRAALARAASDSVANWYAREGRSLAFADYVNTNLSCPDFTNVRCPLFSNRIVL
jgi:hypothetical protein